VLGKVLTGYSSGAGTLAATDTILQAINKLNGNDGLKANLASPTFTGTVSGITAAMVGLGNVPNLAFSGSNTGDETNASILSKLALLSISGSNSGDDAVNALYSGLASAKQAALSGTGFVKIADTTISYDSATYLTANQTITLTGDVSGTGTTAITTTLGNNKVNGAMLALGSDTRGDVMFYNGTDWARLPVGTSGQFLKTQGAGADPLWATDNNTTYAASGTLLALSSSTFSVKAGTLNSGKLCIFDTTLGLVCDTDSASVGHSALTLAGTLGYLTLSGQEITRNSINLTTDVTANLPTGNGGTGLSATPTDGQILIGNGTGYTLSTIGASTGISINTATSGHITLANTGVTSLIGTANQVIAAAVGGVVTLSLPQAIATTSSPEFLNLKAASLTLTNALTPANGGTGLSAISQNSILYASGTSILSSLTPSANQFLITNASSVPNFTNISADNFTQYALLAGRSGGQTLNGGTVASNNLILDSNSTVTKGYVLLNPTGGNVGIGTTTPAALFAVGSTSQFQVDTVGKVTGGTYNGLTLAIAVDGFSIAGGTTARTLTVTGGDASVRGTNTGDQTITLTGDITGTGIGSFATTIGSNRVTGAMIALGSDAQGDVMFYNGTDWVRLGAGTTGQTLKTQGTGVNPVWAADNNTIYAAAADNLLSLTGAVFSVKQGTMTSGKLCSYDGTNLVCNTDGTGVGHVAVTLAGTVDYLTAVGQAITLNQIDLTADITGTLPIAKGGTNLTTTPANGQLLVGNGTGYTLAALTASTGISVTNAIGSITLANTGVISLAGTANQVNVSASSGTITLSLPQAISTTSDVTFKTLTLSNALTPANGGTGLASISQNSILYASGTNVLSALTPSANQFLITNGSSVPTFTNLSSDIFTQYALLAGRSGGQTLNGGTVASNNLVLDSNSTATKGFVLLNPTGGNVGIGTTTPAAMLSVFGVDNALRLSYDAANYSTLATNSTGELQIKGASVYDATLTLGSNDTQNVALIFDNNSNTTDFYAGVDTDDSGKFKIGLLDSDPFLTINSVGGNVGIGTTAPAALLSVGATSQFQVNAAGNVAGGTYNGNTLTAGTGTLNLASYSLALSGSSNINQNLLTTSAPTFAGLTVNGTLTQSGSTSGYLASMTNTETTTGGGLFIRSNGTGNLLTLNNAGTDILTVSPVQTSFNVPTSFNTSGDVSIASDLILTNQTATSLKTNSSFTLDVGESFEANSLTLKTYNAGEVIIDGGVTAAYPLHVYRSTDGNVAGFTDTNGTCAINPTNTALVCSSDATMKKDVVTLASADALAAVKSLRLVNFHWNKEETTDPLHTGIIAQEIATILPNLVSVGSDGKLAVNYLGLVPYTLSAIQQQQLQIADVTTNLSTLGLKTDANVTTLAGLQTSVDANLVTINGKFTALDSALATQATTLATLQTQATAADAVATELQTQIEEIKLQNERYDALNKLIAIIDPTTLLFIDSLGNLDLLDGKLEAAELTAGVLTIKIVDAESPTLGQATVAAGQDNVVVSTKAIAPASKIFVTPVNSTPPMTQKTIERKDDTPIVLEIPITWSISEQLTGISFTVKTSGLVSQEMKFNWWIVQEQRQ
jgi:hypothetical protein